jgi:2-polyprenyl-6-methoxyphenol hydroxylase-like FAD-dependent oxidoreductase
VPTVRTTTRVCIAGGGPAGVMLGLLLARAGVEVVVLERHADFFRDFRGDTVHPSTLNIIDTLGLREQFDEIPHRPLRKLDVVVNGVRVHAIDFGTLPPPNRLLTLMPQWDLLELLAAAGRRHRSFDLRMGCEVTDVIRTATGRVRGVIARTLNGEIEVDADLVIAADGRDSTTRRAVGLTPRPAGVPADVIWFRLPYPATGLPDTLAWLSEEGMVITIPRPGYLQCGMLIPKGSFDDVHTAGLDAFRARVGRAVPPLHTVASELETLGDLKLLSVQIDRLQSWWVPGMLCIGDAAHAMSPAFGVGINYAIQDAVASAHYLLPALRSSTVDPGAVDAACAAVQRRRALPTALMQRIQRGVHRTLATGRGIRLLHNPPTTRQRVMMRLIIPLGRPLLARLVGYGFRPERLGSRS